uniref:Uncharacterized protein n=1 Tax=Timema genevievae TaxID=629358 RepID=A0A7R9JW09_TIMGE|nr:unnamed protein product [Timema genevievae]
MKKRQCFEKPLSVRNIAIIALRDVDREERAIMDKFSIATYSMHHIDKLGVVNVVQEALSRIDPTSSLPLHISFDIDMRGGITLREGIQLIEEVYNTGRLSAFDMTEVNLRLGNIRDSQLTLEAAKHLLRAVFGHQRRGDLPNETLISKLKSYKLATTAESRCCFLAVDKMKYTFSEEKKLSLRLSASTVLHGKHLDVVHLQVSVITLPGAQPLISGIPEV